MKAIPAIAVKTSLRIIFLFGAAVLVPVEIVCARSALETQGEVMRSALLCFVGTNFFWALWSWRAPRIALTGLFATALLIVPYQVVLLDRLTRLNSEMVCLVDSRLRLRAEGKPIPATLDDYPFSDPGLRRYISGYAVEDNAREFSIYYFVVDRGIAHSYSSKTGWSYYPD